MGSVHSLPHSAPQNRGGCDVVVVGLGYVGLPTAALISAQGQSVCGVDVLAKVVETINAGAIHIHEPGLDELVASGVASGTLRAALQPETARTYLIAVPTPIGAEQRPDTSHVMAAMRSIAPVIATGALVILESTSPIGTTHEAASLLADLRPDLAVPGHCGDTPPQIHMAYCPERVLPGRALEELAENDRVIGGITPECSARARDFYASFVQGQCITTSARAAEMVKLVENSFRDVNIAFANELSVIAEGLGIDVWEVIRLANRHPRVNILQPGPGVGGHCIAVDPLFLVASDPRNARLISTARAVNDAKPDHVVRRVTAIIESLPDARVACLGLAFKPDIDDFRESPALEVVKRLANAHGPRLRIVEPFLASLPASLARLGPRLTDLESALAECEVVVVLVDHSQFRDVSADLRRGKIVYDTRGMWHAAS